VGEWEFYYESGVFVGTFRFGSIQIL